MSAAMPAERNFALDSKPVPSVWQQDEVWRAKQPLQFYIDLHCGLYRRIGYYGLWSR